ncbi:MAG TPA: D-alanyl-D-alanine carboxypeptidase family protein [Symbiobacteriaceae bacterium]|jgi:D-alanyl-D-alanine carboxypeptidase (penicillin-binding protein 5/6)
MAGRGLWGKRLAAAACCLALWPGITMGAPSAGAVPTARSPLEQPNPAWKTPPPPGLSAGAAILLDWRTGQVLWSRNADQRRDPASTTKILTAVIAVERGKLSDPVKISARAASTVGSSMYVRQGEIYSLHDLLHGLLLRSGNDAAVAIAEHIAGSVEAFAGLMNEKAKAVGATHSHFANPHGLTDPQHYTTARDLALITRYAVQNPTVAGVVALKEQPLTFEFLHRDVVLYNTNRLLRTLEGADGVKTGTTAAAGACLIASATRDEQKLVAVVLNAGNRWRDAQGLLEWGFKSFQLVELAHQGETLLSVPVKSGKDIAVPVALSRDLTVVTPRQPGPGPQLEVETAPEVPAPVQQGQRLGRVRVKEGGLVVAEGDLMAVRDVAEATWVDLVYRRMRPLLRWMSMEHFFS